jgi:tetratricopeptide (TPR) repeat protein
VNEAIAHYRKAVELKPGFAEAHFNLGVALADRGQVEEAIAHYQKALEIKPDFVDARRNLEALRSKR